MAGMILDASRETVAGAVTLLPRGLNVNLIADAALTRAVCDKTGNPVATTSLGWSGALSTRHCKDGFPCV
jgi:hypothetical protein